MKPGQIARIVGAALLVMALNVGVSILYMFIYGYLINPGHPEQFYQEHVQTAAPWCSIIAGAPLMFLICRWLASRWERASAVRAAVSVWVVYAAIDLLVLGGSWMNSSPKPWLIALVVISLATKLAAAYLGGTSGARRALAVT